MKRTRPLHDKWHRFRTWLRRVLFHGHWMIGIIDQPIGNALHWTQAPPIRWIAPFDRKRYIADPFPWPGSSDTILCEICVIENQVGQLSALKLDSNGLIDEMPITLPVQSHLSFPYLFMLEGVVFMMPESCASGKLEIFEWNEGDGKWTLFTTIFHNKPVADATLFEKDGLLWISYTDVTHNPHDNLNLIYAPSLNGPWVQHPANPVRRGTESSRNGGSVFEVEGRLYRPAQDCSRVYGGSLRIMEITACTPTSYAEKEITHITPSSRHYPDGMHTLMAWGDKCLVDGMRLTFDPKLFLKKVLRRLGLRK